MNALSTSYSHPYALLKFGGTTPGKRPGTRLGFIVEAVAVNGHIQAFKAVTFDKSGRATKRPRLFAVTDVIREWRRPPTAKTVRTTRMSIRAVAS